MKTSIHDIALDYEQLGAGPAIVFIHDGPDNRAIDDPRLTALSAAGFRVILTNLRGLSRCDGATVDDLTRDSVALLDYLGIGRAVVFGIGRGGCVLLNLLEQHPERIVGSSLVIPPAMAASLSRFTGRSGLTETLRTERAAPLLSELFTAVPAPPCGTTTLTELPGLCAWLDRVGGKPLRPGKTGLALLAELQLPLLLIEPSAPAADRRWRARLGGRLRAFNASLLALLDLVVPKEEEAFDDEALGESR